MLELFKESYYYLDLLIGFSSPLLFYFLYKTGRIEKFMWHFFWIGVMVGLTWEIPIFVLSGESTCVPIVTWTRPLIAHYLVFMISHSLWRVVDIQNMPCTLFSKFPLDRTSSTSDMGAGIRTVC